MVFLSVNSKGKNPAKYVAESGDKKMGKKKGKKKAVVSVQPKKKKGGKK